MSNIQLILRNCEISPVCYQNFPCHQLILRNSEISWVCYQNFHCLVDSAKLRNQFSFLSEFPLFSQFCEIAKSVQFTIRIFTVQLILRNCEISSVCYRDFPCSVDFAKLQNQFSLLSEFPLFSWLCEIAKSVQFAIRVPLFSWFCEITNLPNQFNFLSEFALSSVDLPKFRNQLSFLSEFPLFSSLCETAKSVQFTIRMSNVQLILRNYEISSIYYQNVQCSVEFAKLRNQFSLLSECQHNIVDKCSISSGKM